MMDVLPRYNWNIVENGVKHHKPTNYLKCSSDDTGHLPSKAALTDSAGIYVVIFQFDHIICTFK